MNKLIEINWYNKLIDDLKELAIVRVVELKHTIGKRILQDMDKFERQPYGSKRIENLAKDLGINRSELYQCLQFAKKEPELSDAVRQLPWRQITHELLPDTKRETKEILLPADKFEIILADPPWKYDVDLSKGFSRSPENNYPVMDLDDLVKFGEKVKQISHKNCTLFMWITAPKLNWMNSVLEAWDFDYKTNLIWDKVKHNLGHYCSVRHEILIIAGKGTCSPESDGKTIQSVDSVQSIPKSTRHSEKPQEFYGIIEKLYPNKKKIELFCRKPRKGWTAWGNEV